VAHVLNPAILSNKLSSYGQRLMGNSWASPATDRAKTLTFADIDKTALSFPSHCHVRPFKRVLCYQAHLARKEAANQGWLQLAFDDFWSEDEPYLAKVQRWLSMEAGEAESVVVDISWSTHEAHNASRASHPSLFITFLAVDLPWVL